MRKTLLVASAAWLLAAGPAMAQQKSLKDQMVGTWTLVSAETIETNGNKVPLVKWHRSYAYVSSTHMLLPRGLNLVYDEAGGEKASGCLLHAKFLDTFAVKAAEEMARGQHYGASAEYRAYQESLAKQPDMWCKFSEKYINWRQLEILGLMSKGNWA